MPISPGSGSNTSGSSRISGLNTSTIHDVPDGDTFWYEKFPGKSLQQIAGLMAKASQVDSALFRPPGEMRKLIDLHAEDYSLVVQLKYKRPHHVAANLQRRDRMAQPAKYGRGAATPAGSAHTEGIFYDRPTGAECLQIGRTGIRRPYYPGGFQGSVWSIPALMWTR